MLSGRGLCDGPITRPEESYRVRCVVLCDSEASIMRRVWQTGGCCAIKNRSSHKAIVSEHSQIKGKEREETFACNG